MPQKPSYEELEQKILELEQQNRNTLKDTEEYLSALSEASFEALFLSDKGICLDQNQTAERMFGYGREEAVGRHGTEWIIARDRELVKTNMLRGYEEPYEVTALRKDGSTFPAEIQGRMIRINARPIRVTALRDITWRKQTETLLRAERILGRTLNQNLLLDEALELCLETAIDVAGMDCGCIYLVKQDGSGLNLTVSRGLTTDFIQYLVNCKASSQQPQLAMNTKPLYLELEEIEITLDTKWVGEGLSTVAILPIHFKGAIVAGFMVASHQDNHIATFARTALEAIVTRIGATIHQAVQEEALQESEAYFHRTFDESPMGAAMMSLDLNFQRVNAALCNITGHTQLELLQLAFADIVDPRDWEKTRKLLAQLSRLEIDHFDQEQRGLSKDGRPLWLLVSVRLVRNVQGDPHYLLPMFVDITARKFAQMELKESEIRYRLLFEKAKDIIFLYSFKRDQPCGNLIEVNQVAVEKLGYSREEFRAMTPLDLLDPKTRGSASCESKILHKEKEHLFELQLYAKDGSSIPVEIHAHRFTYGESQAVLSIARDISERRKTEQLLRTTAEIVEKIPSGMLVYEYRPPDMLYLVSGNPAAEKLTGISVSSYIGKEYTDIWPMSVGLRQNLLNVIHTGEVYYSEELHFGEYPRQYAFKIAAFPMPNHRLGVAFEDITQQKELAEELRQAHKMEALGTLAGGIAHEFNNIISIILGSCELALEDLPDLNPADELLRNIRDACLRARDVVKQLLSYSRKSDETKKPTKLQPIIKETINLLRASMPNHIEFQQTIDSQAGAVMADGTQMNQVLLNLCSNAIQSMEEMGGTLKVTLENLTLSADQFEGQAAATDVTQYVRLAVSDTGCGIDPHHLERIFDPFFSTKPVDKGTGMGLAVVHGIVKNHGGEILAHSEPNKGTTVEILIPAVTDALPVLESN